MTGASCSEPVCSNPVKARGLCSTHYEHLKRTVGLPDAPRCSAGDCERPAYGHGLCAMHNKRVAHHGHAATLPTRTGCAVAGCDRFAKAHGLCQLHSRRLKRNGTIEPLTPLTPLDRFMAKVAQDPMSGCWLWTGGLAVGRGGEYGHFSTGGLQFRAHRWLYEQTVGPIPDGLQLDHLCRVTICVNPNHVEPVTAAENLRRAAQHVTSCPAGHPYDEANTYYSPAGSRECRACKRARTAARRLSTVS